MFWHGLGFEWRVNNVSVPAWYTKCNLPVTRIPSIRDVAEWNLEGGQWREEDLD